MTTSLYTTFERDYLNPFINKATPIVTAAKQKAQQACLTADGYLQGALGTTNKNFLYTIVKVAPIAVAGAFLPPYIKVALATSLVAIHLLTDTGVFRSHPKESLAVVALSFSFSALGNLKSIVRLHSAIPVVPMIANASIAMSCFRGAYLKQKERPEAV